MIGREDKKCNDLFYVCSLIDCIARQTTNKRSYIVNTLGKAKIEKIYDLADIYHSDNIERVANDFITSANIENGTFDNVAEAKYAIPSYWDIGKVYKRLILGVAKAKNISIVDALIEVYNSFISEKIDNYNSSFYYEVPSVILNSYLNGRIE